MAAPESVTIDDLTGVYNLDKTLGDDSSNMLKMQGVGFIIRQAIAYSAVEITLKQTKDAEGITHLDSMQVSTGNQKNDEHWTMNNIETEVDNRIWGKVKGTAKFSTLAELPDDEYLKQGWIGDKFITSDIHSSTDTWTAFQVLGFAMIDGKRMHVRRVVGKKGSKVEKIRLVYGYKSPV